MATDLMFAELDGLLGYLLRRAQGAMHRDFMAAVADFELTQKQAATLWLIHANARRVAGRSRRGAGHGSRHHDGADRSPRRSRLRHPQALVDGSPPPGPVSHAGGAEHPEASARRASPSTKKNSARCSRAPELAALLDALKRFQNLG